MSALTSGRRNAVLLVVLVALQLLLASASVREASGAARTEALVIKLTGPVIGLANLGAGSVRSVIREAKGLLLAHGRNAVLEAELDRVSGELVRSREALEENRRLRRLLDMKERLAPLSVAASVISCQLDEATHMILVDRGSRDRVTVDLPVVAWGGAVGRVVQVGPRHAKVRLLTDSESGVAGLVQRSRAQGVLLGAPGPELQLRYVPRFSDVVHGDRVVTSGLDGIFPKGYGLGRVTAIAERPDGTQTISVLPEIDYSVLEEVLILLMPGQDEIEAGEPGGGESGGRGA